MALTQNNIILSSDIINLKSRVKAEMQYRNQVGSLNVNPYNTDFTYSADVGDLIRKEHYNETVGYINQINTISSTLPSNVDSGSMIYALDAASDKIDQFSTYSHAHMRDNTTDCANSCTGLCYTQCSGGCRTTCTATCANSCNNGCSSGDACRGSCTGECRSGDACRGSCVTDCAPDACTNSCLGWCNNSCWVDYCSGGPGSS